MGKRFDDSAIHLTWGLRLQQFRLDRVDPDDQQRLGIARQFQRRAGAGGGDRPVTRQELDPAETRSAQRAEPDQPGDLPLDRHRLGQLDAVLLDPAVEEPRRLVAPQQLFAVLRPEPCRAHVCPMHQHPSRRRRFDPLCVHAHSSRSVPYWYKPHSELNNALDIPGLPAGPYPRPPASPHSLPMVKLGAFDALRKRPISYLASADKGNYGPAEFQAALAQLVRALDCGSRGPPFDPGRRYQKARSRRGANHTLLSAPILPIYTAYVLASLAPDLPVTRLFGFPD